MRTHAFKCGQYVQAVNQLVIEKTGEVYLEQGEVARIMVIDPAGHEGNPYGLRKEYNPVTGAPAEHITKNFFTAEQLRPSPAHPVKPDVWTDKPEEYFSHPKHPRHEELRSVGWRVTPN